MRVKTCVYRFGGVVVLLLMIPFSAFGWSSLEQVRIDEHLPWGIPALTQPHVQTVSFQTAYISCYNTDEKCPEWVAYHVIADYLETPKREGSYATMRDHLNAESDDYTLRI
ncbi:hypothetical protein ACFLS5_02255 [Candidatus Bipolaricaulota bacterium]